MSNRMSKWSHGLLALLALALSAGALAQFETGENLQPEKKPWEEFKLDEKKTVSIRFRNASPDAVLDFYSRASGITLVKDPQLRDPLTVTSAKPVKLKEAFELLEATLGLINYQMRKEGSFIVIRKREERRGGFDMSQFQGMMGGEGVLRVYRIRYAQATQVARVINEVYQQRQQGPQFPFGPGGFFGMMQQQQQGGRGGRGGNTMGGGFPGRQEPSVRASADDFSNTVIVNAPDRQQNDVQDLITQIDQPSEVPLTSMVYPLQFAFAEEMQPIIQNVLVSSSTTGRAASGAPQPGFGQRFQGGFGFGGGFGGGFAALQRQQGQVTSDARTNSLIVTTNADNQQIVGQVIQQLDREVQYEATTYVLPIANARADEVATLINQAFGNTGNRNRATGGTGQFRTNQQNQQRRNNQGGFGGGGFGGGNTGFGGGRLAPDGQSLELPLTNPELDESELLTQVFVEGGGLPVPAALQDEPPAEDQGQAGTTAAPQQPQLPNFQGPTREIKALVQSGQVQVIPDPNTNRLIIVGSPDSFELIRQIVGEIDAVPEQVMIETMVVEATLDKSTKMGIEWSLSTPKLFGSEGVTGTGEADFGLGTSGTGNSAPQGFRYTIGGGNLEAFINALQTDDRYQVLSTPRIFTSNNVTAEINISQRVPYVLSTREDNNGNLTFNYSFLDVGIILNVTPRITANGSVTLDVTQTANDLQGFTDFNAPIVNQRQADTTVTVADGQTIILGGMIRTIVNSRTKKLPLLGDIPILGQLFRSTERQNVKTELLVFLTPRLVRDAQAAGAMTNQAIDGASKTVQRQIQDSHSNP